MILNKIFKNILLVLAACLVLTGCATKKVDFLTWNIYLVVKKYNIEISSKEQFNDIKQNF